MHCKRTESFLNSLHSIKCISCILMHCIASLCITNELDAVHAQMHCQRTASLLSADAYHISVSAAAHLCTAVHHHASCIRKMHCMLRCNAKRLHHCSAHCIAHQCIVQCNYVLHCIFQNLDALQAQMHCQRTALCSAHCLAYQCRYTLQCIVMHRP